MGFCQYCGHSTTEDENFCGQCGALLSKSVSASETLEMPKIVVCSECGNVAPPDAKFCSQCGGPVSEELLENVAKKGLPGWAVVLIAVALVAVIAVAGVVAWRSYVAEPGAAQQEQTAALDAQVTDGEGSAGDADAADGEGQDGAADAAEDEAAEAEAEVDPSEYILPDSDKRLYSSTEIAELDADTLYFARNEIYARHGRIFTQTDLQEYFESKSWYTPIYKPSEFDTVEGLLNEYEVANINKIASREMALGTMD